MGKLDKLKLKFFTKLQSTVINEIRGKLRNSDIYFSEFENMTLNEFFDLSVQDSDDGKKAKKMLKLLKETQRLIEKEEGRQI